MATATLNKTSQTQTPQNAGNLKLASGTKPNDADPTAADLVTRKTVAISKDAGTQENPLADAVVGDAVATGTPSGGVQDTSALGFLEEYLPPLHSAKKGVRPLTKTEMDELESYEAIVRQGMPTFLAVGQALLKIREKKLWRMYCKSYREYLEKRMGISPQYASMQTKAAEVNQNLLTIGEQIQQPSTERQIRSLVGLSPKDQVSAWMQVVTNAAGRKITGKMVEEAVAEIMGENTGGKDWVEKIRTKFVAAGYETDFLQPVDLGDKTWVDLLDEDTDTYIKLVDQPTLANLGTCLAMKDRQVKYQLVINGLSIPKSKLEKSKGMPSRVLDRVMSVFIHSLGAFLEYDGVLYEAEALGDDFKLELKPSDSDAANSLRAALNPQPVVETVEE